LSLSIGRYLLASQNLLHTEAHTGTIAAAFTRTFLLRRLGQVVTILLAEGAADLPVLPEITLAAACGTVLMVSDAVDDNDVLSVHGILHIEMMINPDFSGNAKTPPMKKYISSVAYVIGYEVSNLGFKFRRLAKRENLVSGSVYPVLAGRRNGKTSTEELIETSWIFTRS